MVKAAQVNAIILLSHQQGVSASVADAVQTLFCQISMSRILIKCTSAVLMYTCTRYNLTLDTEMA